MKTFQIVFSAFCAAVCTVVILAGLNGRSVVAQPQNYFVKPQVAGDCTQATPCNLATAINQSSAGDLIYVGAGIYTSTEDAVISIMKSITLYGGWDGAATGSIVRNPKLYESVLDGEDSRRVVAIWNSDPRLEGFTITRGNSVDQRCGNRCAAVYRTAAQGGDAVV